MKPLSLLLVLQLTAALALADETTTRHRAAQSPQMERVLLPVLNGNAFLEGAAVWFTDFELRNDNAFGAAMFFPFACISEICPPATPFVVRPGQIFKLSYPGSHGVFLNVERRGLPDLTYTLRIKDIANLIGSGPMLGAELPLVAEDEFRSAIHIVNIPTEPQTSDIALRIYQLGTSGGTVDVEVGSTVFNRDDLLVHEVAALSPGERVSGFDAFPGYAQIDLRQAILGRFIEQGRLAVWVRASDPDTKIWAFVMIRNPDSRTPTIITPRR
jgi:hypothetical protein